jgi:predicted Zn-dependent peptidase
VATLLASYLGSEDNSRLFWSIRQKGLADEVWADYEGFSDSGLLYGYAAIERESVDLARRRMATEFALLQKKLDLGLFERAQSKILTDTVCERESPLERFDAVVSLLTAHGRPKTLEAEVAEYQRVTDRDVRTFLEKYPTDRGIACVVMKGSRDDNP